MEWWFQRLMYVCDSKIGLSLLRVSFFCRWYHCVFFSANQPTAMSFSYMALQRVSRVWEFVDNPRLHVFWYKNRVILWCLFCRRFPNGKLLMILGCWFSCFFDIAESCFVLFCFILFYFIWYVIPLNCLFFFGMDTRWCESDGSCIPTPKVERIYEWNSIFCWI